jgi:hypothetical protein
MKPVIQKVTSDPNDIPSHYVPLASFGCHSGTRPATRKYLLLSEAWKNKRLSGWKLMATPQDLRGKVFIDPSDAARLLSEAGEVDQESAASLLSSCSPDVEPAFTAELREVFLRLCAAADRIADAVEAIATKP